MDGNHTSHPKRPAADPIAKLEKGGGAVWAHRRGQGPHLELKYARRQGADAVLEGTIHAAALVPYGAGMRRMRCGSLISRSTTSGCSAGSQIPPGSSSAPGSFARIWTARSSQGPSTSPSRCWHGCTEPSRPPIGWSTVRLERKTPAPRRAAFSPCPRSSLGSLIGGLLTVARGEALPLIEAAIFAAVVGMSLGFLVFGVLAPRVLALVPATRAGAAETAMRLQLADTGPDLIRDVAPPARDRAAGRGPAPRDQRRDLPGCCDPADAIHVPGDLAPRRKD